MWTWILVYILASSGHIKCEESTTFDAVGFTTTFIPFTSPSTASSIAGTSEMPKVSFKFNNSTLEETQKKLQKIANITIAQFLNKQSRRNLTLSEILELRDLGNLIMNPNYMIPTMMEKSNKTVISRIVLPSTTMMNLGTAILKSDFMPTSFLSPPDPPKVEEEEEKVDNLTMVMKNATIEVALATMAFHRKMMHEFLCRNYVAESILQMLEKDAALFGDDSLFSDRQGEAMEPELNDAVAEMFTDTGSSRYKDWLARSAVLTDVYRNMGGFEPVPYVVKYKPSEDYSAENKEDKSGSKSREEEDDDDDEDDKEVRKKPSKKKKKKRKKKPKPKPEEEEEEEEEDDPVEDEEEMEDDDDHDGEAGGTILQVIDSHGHGHGHHYETVDNGWSIFRFGFVDFYDSALTAIAFMTFGIFTLQVFINLITNASAPKMGILVNNSTSAPPVNKRSLDIFQVRIINATENLPPSILQNTTEKLEPKHLEADKIKKEKENLKEEMHNFTVRVMDLLDTPVEEHSKPTFELVKVEEVIPNVELYPDPEPSSQEEQPGKAHLKFISAEEVVAKFALVTLRAVLKMDDPRCLHAALCRANRATLQLEGPPRLWLPMWSVGMSWLAQRAGGIPGSQELVNGALNNLKASVLGLAGVKCESIYPAC